ncbi:MAG: NADH-quinone oxidoreductase subunit NuoK [Nitrospinota bacterium]
MVPPQYYLALAALVFVIGGVGVLVRRNVIMILMSIELMLNAVNLTFIAFAKIHGNMMGQMFVIFVITVAAVEAAVGLALIISLNRRKATLNVDEITLLRW